MPAVLVPVELSDLRATAGRSVSITVPVMYPAGASSAAVSSATARARQELQQLVLEGKTSLDPLDGGADLTVTGRLRAPWSSVWTLRHEAYQAAERGGAALGISWRNTGPEDVSILDLDEPPIEKTIPGPGSWYTDPTGESNPDGTVNYDTVLRAGAQQGLENFGEGVGAVAGGVGEGVKSALGGFFGGLGLGWSIVLVLVLVVGALLVLAYAFGGAGLL